MVVVTKRGSGERGQRFGRTRQRILGLHDLVGRTTRGCARTVCGSAIGAGSAICLVRGEVSRPFRHKIEHLRVVPQSLHGLQEIGVERSPEAERLAGADRVDGENIPFAGHRLRQPSLAYCDRLAGGCGRTGDGQRVSDEIVLLLRRRSDRNNMDIDVVQGQGNVGVGVIQQARGSGNQQPSAKAGAQLGDWGQVQRLNGRDLARNHLRGVRRDVQILLACLPGFRIGFVCDDNIIGLHRLCDRGGHLGARRHVLRPGERAVERVHVAPTGRYVVGKQGLVVHNECETGGPDSLGHLRIEGRVRLESGRAAIKRLIKNGKQDRYRHGLDSQSFQLLQLGQNSLQIVGAGYRRTLIAIGRLQIGAV